MLLLKSRIDREFSDLFAAIFCFRLRNIHIATVMKKIDDPSPATKARTCSGRKVGPPTLKQRSFDYASGRRRSIYRAVARWRKSRRHRHCTCVKRMAMTWYECRCNISTMTRLTDVALRWLWTSSVMHRSTSYGVRSGLINVFFTRRRPVDVHQKSYRARTCYSQVTLVIEIIKTCGCLAFSLLVGPRAWNALPSDIKLISTRTSFRQRHKTHFWVESSLNFY